MSKKLAVVIPLLLLIASFFVTSAVLADPPGNNGTVKIHEGSTESEPIVHNQPHVACTFHVHFFFGDTVQAGPYWIQSWPPTGDKTTVLEGEAIADANGEFVSAEYTLPAGHYKLFYTGRNAQNIKHKVFWVDECPLVETPTPTPTLTEETPTPTPTPTESLPTGNVTQSPEESQPNTAMEFGSPGSSPAPLFALVLLLALGGLAYANVKAKR